MNKSNTLTEFIMAMKPGETGAICSVIGTYIFKLISIEPPEKELRGVALKLPDYIVFDEFPGRVPITSPDPVPLKKTE